MNLLPFLILLLVAFMSNSSAPAISLSLSREYQEPVYTANKNVTFYVRDAYAFDERYPFGGSERRRLEGQVRLTALLLCAAAHCRLRELVEPELQWCNIGEVPIEHAHTGQGWAAPELTDFAVFIAPIHVRSVLGTPHSLSSRYDPSLKG